MATVSNIFKGNNYLNDEKFIFHSRSSSILVPFFGGRLSLLTFGSGRDNTQKKQIFA